MELFEQREHVGGCGASESIFLAAILRDRGVSAKYFGVNLGFRKAQLLHGFRDVGDTDLIEHQIRCGVVREGDHQMVDRFERQDRGVREMVGKDAGSWYFVFLSQRHHAIAAELAGVDLAIVFDHHRKLDQACGWHNLLGAMEKRFAGSEVFDGHADGALVFCDQRFDPFRERLGMGRRYVSHLAGGQGAQKPDGPSEA